MKTLAKQLGAAALIAVAVGAALWVVVGDDFREAGAGGSPGANSSIAPVSLGDNAAPAVKAADADSPQSSTPIITSIPTPGATVLENPNRGLLALDANEAAWLRLNGYPTADELQNLEALDWALIESRRTDPVALVLLGERAAKAGRLDEARSLFSASVGRGSLYGAMRAGQMYSLEAQKNGGDPSEWILGMTPALVARGLGDHQAGAWIERSIPAQARMDPSISESAALSALDEIARRGQWAVEAGRGGLMITPRPNARRWEEMAQRPDLPVNVVTLQSPYRRGP